MFMSWVEVHRSEDDPARHQETPHHAAWHEAMEGMMAERRRGLWYSNVFPAEESGWPHDSLMGLLDDPPILLCVEPARGGASAELGITF